MGCRSSCQSYRRGSTGTSRSIPARRRGRTVGMRARNRAWTIRDIPSWVADRWPSSSDASHRGTRRRAKGETAMAFTITDTIADGTATFTLVGELDASSAPAFHDKIETAAAASVKKLVLDLSK